MGLHFFAHNGEDHAQTAITAATIPWWKDELTVSIVLMIGFISVLAVTHYVFKAKFGLKVILAMAYLLVIGVLCYTVAPILSIVSLSVGMFIALTTTMLSLAHKQPHKNSPGK